MSTSVSSEASSPLQAVADADFASVHITQARAYAYRVPQSKTSQSRPINYLVVLKGTTADGRPIEGLGEGQPRSWRTGDDAGNSWNFLTEAVAQLYDQHFSAANPDDALETVRACVKRFAELAHQHSIDSGYKRPYRGTMLGLEVAVLDLLAKTRNVTLAQLLGQKREAAPLAPPAVSGRTKLNALQRTLKDHAETYEYTRLTGSEDTDSTLDLLDLVSTTNRSRTIGQPSKPLWLDLNGALTREQASKFLQEVTASATAGALPAQIILEQPVPVKYSDYLGALQKQANDSVATSERKDLEIRIVGDESIFDAHNMTRLRKVGGIRGVNIRPAQAGGLLASIDLAKQVLKQDPDSKIFLTRMVGASRITASALRHLALALPQIDAAVVSSTVEKTLKMSSRVKTEEELADEAQRDAEREAATQQAEYTRVADEMSPATGAVQVIDSDGDDEPETDDPGGEENETATSASGVEASYESADSEGDPGPDEEESGETDITDDDAEQQNDVDMIRRFRVRNVPGIGVELKLAGLVSDVQDAVTYPPSPEATYNGIPVAKYDDVDDLHPLGPNGSKGHLLEREALALGLNTTRYSKGAFTATDGESDPIPFKWSRNPLSSAASLALSTHKEATRMQLQQAGVPVPQGRTFARGDYQTAKEFVARIGYPVVVKPTMGVRGIGVVAGIKDEEQLDAAFKLMSGSKLGHQDFIVEKHVHGADYRIVVVGDEVIAAIQREPASVFGDGKSTIAELLISKNVARKRNPHLWARPAKYDEAARHELQKSGRDLDTVLPEGERQLLANTCSLSQGGDSIDVVDEMHPSIKQACVAAVKAMPGLAFCGVDFLLEDHTKRLDEQDAGICELNAHAAIGNCEYPMFGKGRPVAKTLIRAAIEHYRLKAQPERVEQVALHLTIRGRVTGVNFRKWLQRRAHGSGVTGWVRNVDRRTAEAVLLGPTDPTTAVAAATILGPRKAVPTAYEARHIPVPDALAGFEIRDDAPEGTTVEAVDAA